MKEGVNLRSKTSILIIFFLLVSITAYITLLNVELTSKQRSIEELSKFKLDYENCINEIIQLNESYTQLSNQVFDLSRRYYTLLEEYVNLTNTLKNITQTYLEYTSLTKSFHRVLNYNEINAIGEYVQVAIVYESSPWDSYRNLYSWVSANIRYVDDVVIPVPTCEFINGSCNLKYIYVENYVQTPSFTLEKKQGDCEDLTILLYAMIKYYQLKILKTEYLTWIAYIELNDNTTHTAIFIPASSGRLTIMDPAGRYLTSNEYGDITANNALDELKNYSNKWLNKGGIKHIELYQVNVTTGNYSLDAAGGVEEIATFIMEITG